MAKDKDKTVPQNESQSAVQSEAQVAAYTAEEFAAAAEKLWPDKKTRPSRYLIAAAFRVNGKTAASKEEGVKLVNKFANKEVK